MTNELSLVLVNLLKEPYNYHFHMLLLVCTNLRLLFVRIYQFIVQANIIQATSICIHVSTINKTGGKSKIE